MGKEEFSSPSPLKKRRVTPTIRKRKRSQEELIDQPRRRSKRQQKVIDSTSIPVTPAPSSSIRDSVRIFSTGGSNGRRKYTGSSFYVGGRRKYTGSSYNLEEVLPKRAPSSPERGHANATEKQGVRMASNKDGPRHCYCYEYCQACTLNTPCELHDGFFCNGCVNWFHAACTGWEIHGYPPHGYMESKMYPDFKIPLGSLSQEDPQPWYIASDAGKTKSLKTQHSYLGLIVVCNNRYFVLGLK